MKTIKLVLTVAILAMNIIAVFAQAQFEPSIHDFTFKKKPDLLRLLADGECSISRTYPKAFGRGRMQVHDTRTGELLYERKLPTEYLMFHSKDCQLLYSNGTLTNCDVRTGAERWKMELQNKRLLWNDEKYLLMTASVSEQGSDQRLYCYDISTRRLLAAPVVDLFDGIEYIKAAEDGMLYIWSDELYKINLHDGKCNQIKTKTQVVSGKKLAGNIGLSIAAVAAGVASAAMTGYVYIPIYHDYPSRGLLRSNGISSSHISNLASQILTDQGLHYISDRECVRCLDSTLQVIWETRLPEKRASMSSLTLVGDTLVMANLGMGLLGGHTPRATGRPFVATFDKHDGHCIYYRELADERSMHLQNMVKEGEVISMAKDSLYLVSPSDSLVQTIRWDASQLGELGMMSQDGLCYTIDNETGRFVSLGTGTDCVISSIREAYRVSVDKDPELLAHEAAFYVGLHLGHDMLLMKGGTDSHDHWITDAAGAPLYHFTESIDIIAVASKAILYQSVADKSYHVARWE